MTRPKIIMPCLHVVSLLEQGKELGATDVGLFGYGEPLMDGLLHEKIAAAKKLGYKVQITTNASLLSAKVAERLECRDAGISGTCRFFRSMGGNGPARYDSSRSQPSIDLYVEHRQ